MQIPNLLRLLGKLDSQDQMLETITIHLLARLRSICPLRKRNERKALRHSGFSVLGQEHTCDATETLEHVAELLFFCHFGDLKYKVLASVTFLTGINAELEKGEPTFVTRNVAKSSLSNFPPILSPPLAAAPPAFLRCGGT